MAAENINPELSSVKEHAFTSHRSMDIDKWIREASLGQGLAKVAAKFLAGAMV